MKIRNLLGSWFIKAFCADSSEIICSFVQFDNFVQISIIARISVQEINFLQSLNCVVITENNIVPNKNHEAKLDMALF